MNGRQELSRLAFGQAAYPAFVATGYEHTYQKEVADIETFLIKQVPIRKQLYSVVQVQSGRLRDLVLQYAFGLPAIEANGVGPAD